MDRSRLGRVRASFDLLQPCGPALIARAMLHLREEHPEVHRHFHLPEPSATFNTRLWNAFGRIVHGLESFSKLETPLMALGIQAQRRGFGTPEVRILRETLLLSMGELLGKDWTPSTRRDWELLLAAVSGAMLRGALQDSGTLAHAA